MLLAARAARVRPALDDKRLTSWNALMISALADAGAALERADYVAAAVACARFIERELRDSGGRLLRTFNRGQAKLPAYLEDHAYLLEAYLTLYEATFDAEWFTRAVGLADELLERFYDPERGGFFSVADDHPGLIARRKDLEDAPIPSGGSAACLGLLRLARFTGSARYEDAALSLIRLVHSLAPAASAGVRPPPAGDRLRSRPGPRGGSGRRRRLRPGAGGPRRAIFPYVVLAGGEGDVPLLRDRGPVDGRPAAYVCERFTCQLPLLSGEDLAKALQT